MTKTLLTACVAALSFGACQKNPPPSPVARVVSPPSRPMPGGDEPIALSSKSRVDAGSIASPEQDVLESDPLTLGHDHSMGVDHLARAQQLKEDGDMDSALIEARRALFDTPDDEETLTLLGHLAEISGHRDLAALAQHRIAMIDTEDPAPAIREARLQISLKEFGKAIEAGNEAIQRDPDNADAYQVTGRAHLAGGDLQGAIDNFNKVLEIDPDQGYALNNLGFALLRASRNTEAAQVLEHAARLLPTVGYVQNNLGVALERVGKHEEAKQAYELASSLSPKYLKAQLNNTRVHRVANASDPELGPLEIDLQP